MNRLNFLSALAFACAASIASAQPPAAPVKDAWKPAGDRIATKWAKDVSPTSVHPEYPRPTMFRSKWQSLNGLWDYSVTPKDKGRLEAGGAGQILVPFPIESSLSGVGRILQPDETLHYWRTIAIPAEWKGSRILLHFGAVDWKTTVSINGKKIGEHTGGYDPFSFDITEALKPDADNELAVEVTDPTDAGGQPRGKQWLKPHAIWYTPTSGIWQTVWMEPVPRKSISRVRVDADPATGKVAVHVADSIAEPDNLLVYEAEVRRDGQRILLQRSPVSPISLTIPSPRAWTPDDPALYDITVRTFLANEPVDQVTSYFAFRDIKLAPDSDGIPRLLLNGKSVFQFGPLDQGFWPDGLYTAPSDEALRFDIEAAKAYGCNMLRKHVKVEPERFYYWCDKLGIMVWQDMPSPFFQPRRRNNDNNNEFALAPEISAEWKTNFERELKAMIDARRHHPSIVMWVPYNEGWGQNDLAWCKEVVEKVKAWDPSRLVNCASGWTDTQNGDVRDIHAYPAPACPPLEKVRAAVLGEYGGLGLPLDAHTWVSKNNWGYVSYKDKDELTAAYIGLLQQLRLMQSRGLCAAVYTQTTDVEIECNGWLTYDRAVWKVDPAKVLPFFMKALYGPPPTIKTVVPIADAQAPIPWRYTTDKPGETWNAADFDDSAWKSGPSGFGTRNTPGARIGTEWSTSDIWIRRTFTLDEVPADPHLWIHHDEDAEVFINGAQVAGLKGYTSDYIYVGTTVAGKTPFRKGVNTIAIHCKQTRGGQYIDCGLANLTEAPAR